MIPRPVSTLLLLASLSACGKRVTSEPSASEQTNAPRPAAHATPSPAPRSHIASPEASRPPPACRALRVRGRANADGGKVIETMSALDGVTWVELETGAEMVIRFPSSARELALSGPGRFLPCREAREQVLMSRGTFRSSSGTGVRPGAEVSVATPFGSLRYGDADLEANVEAESLRVAVRGGSVTLEPAPGIRGLPEGTITGPDGRAMGSGRPEAERLTRACTEAAKKSGESALWVVDRGVVDAGLGERAALQLRTRRRARAACETARAGLDRELAPAQRARLGDQIAAADALWQAVPTPKARDPK